MKIKVKLKVKFGENMEEKLMLTMRVKLKVTLGVKSKVKWWLKLGVKLKLSVVGSQLENKLGRKVGSKVGSKIGSTIAYPPQEPLCYCRVSKHNNVKSIGRIPFVVFIFVTQPIYLATRALVVFRRHSQWNFSSRCDYIAGNCGGNPVTHRLATLLYID